MSFSSQQFVAMITSLVLVMNSIAGILQQQRVHSPVLSPIVESLICCNCSFAAIVVPTAQAAVCVNQDYIVQGADSSFQSQNINISTNQSLCNGSPNSKMPADSKLAFSHLGDV